MHLLQGILFRGAKIKSYKIIPYLIARSIQILTVVKIASYHILVSIVGIKDDRPALAREAIIYRNGQIFLRYSKM